MSTTALGVLGLGMCSALGTGAAVNATAMRLGYDGFAQTAFTQPFSPEPQLGAAVAFAGAGDELRGLPRLAAIAAAAIGEALADAGTAWERTPLLLCLAEPERPGPCQDQQAANALFGLIQEADPAYAHLHPDSRIIRAGRCGFAHALRLARQLAEQDARTRCLICGVDTCLSVATLGWLGGDLYGEGRRLLGEDHPDGFIPGEAATAACVGAAETHPHRLRISGIGLAEEPVTHDSDEVLRGLGLAAAINRAAEQAATAVHETHFRIASLSGEEYFFREAALAQIKTLKQKVPDHPLWHPADAIGETGAAVGGAMLVMAHQAMVEGYAPGPRALCHISNDGPRRAAFILEYAGHG